MCTYHLSLETEAETGTFVQMTYRGNVLRRNMQGSKELGQDVASNQSSPSLIPRGTFE